MKTLVVITILASVSFAKSKVAKWEPLLETDDIKISKFEENAPNGQHNKYNFLIKYTAKDGKEHEQALIKDLQEDWLESRSEYGFNDDVLSVKIEGVDGIDKGNGVTEKKPFKIEKCFKLNAAKTQFAPVKCGS